MSESGLPTATQSAPDSPAFPRAARVLAVVLLANLVLMGLWLSPKLLDAQWTPTGLLLFALAGGMVLWMGHWIVHSRTCLQGDQLTQTWLWTKRVRVADVASLKLVHLPWLQRLVAPRLLVRRRGGGVTWFHSADAQLLLDFSAQVLQHKMAAPSP